MIYTYEEIKNALTEKLSLLNNWKKTLFMGVYDSLFSAIAYAINRKVIYPAEVFYRESFLSTATKYSSVIPRLKYLSYTEHRKRGAYGNIILTGDPVSGTSDPFDEEYIYTGNTVIIPRWTEFTDETRDITVYSIDEVIYYNGTIGSLDIPVKEGKPKQFIYTSVGDADEKVTLYSNEVDNDELEVTIVDSDDNWIADVKIAGIDTEEKYLFFINNTVDYICEVSNSYDFQSVVFTFGNGINTRKLDAGERVRIRYADTKGVEGNIESVGIITQIKSTLYDSLENKVTLYVRNEVGISDGSDVEDLDSMKNNSSNLFGTGYRCGSYDDWGIVLQNHPYIHKAIIWTTDDFEDDTITTNQNKIFISAISASGDALTVPQQQDITINYLKYDKKSPTERVIWEPLKIVYAKFDVEAVVQNQSFLVVEGQINEKLKENYYILNTTFKQDIYDSNFTRIIDNIDSVVRHNTSLSHMEKGDFTYYVTDRVLFPSWTEENTLTAENQVFLLENSLQVWLRTKDEGGEFGPPILVAYDENNILRANDNTYINIDLGANRKISSLTGLENSSRVYTATIQINNFAVQNITVVGSQAQTMSELVDQIKADVSDINVTFSNNTDSLKFGVDTTGESTLTLVDGDLFSSIFSGNASIDDPVNGFKYIVTGGNLNYTTNTVSFVVNDLSSIPPEDFELAISYKTKDGDGNQTNDIRLKRFNIITSVDEAYNTFNLRYE